MYTINHKTNEEINNKLTKNFFEKLQSINVDDLKKLSVKGIKDFSLLVSTLAATTVLTIGGLSVIKDQLKPYANQIFAMSTQDVKNSSTNQPFAFLDKAFEEMDKQNIYLDLEDGKFHDKTTEKVVEMETTTFDKDINKTFEVAERDM